MTRFALLLGVASGCFHPTYDHPACGPGGECPPGLTCIAGMCGGTIDDDAPVVSDTSDAPDGPPADSLVCLGTGAWQLCASGAGPTAPQTLSGTTMIDTDSSSMCASDITWTSATQPAACVIAATTITVPGTVFAIGSKPLVLFATDSVVFGAGAMLDVASHHLAPSVIGAGGDAAACTAFTVAPVDSAAGGGGGAGASFMTVGGNGGAGGMGATAGAAVAADAAAPSVLRGGCRGQTGGTGFNNVGAGPGGHGGGAVYVVAGTAITLASGTINASGAGGLPGSSEAAGAGGGGGGGMIALAAPTITSSTGHLVANGGAGAGGAGSSTGSAGSDPTPTSPTSPALGGQNGAGLGCGGSGARGGNGFAGATQATVGMNGSTGNTCGGGGGGAGGGYIRTSVAISGVTASPTPTVVP